MYIPVEFVNPDIPGGLMQSVHVLGYDAAQFVRLFQFKQFPVRRVGFRFRIQQMPPVIIKKALRLQIEKRFAQNHLRRKAVSGIPLAVETPAPPKKTIRRDRSMISCSALISPSFISCALFFL